MAVPAVLSGTQNPPDVTSKFFDFLARRPQRVPRVMGTGDVRLFVTTDAVTSGPIANLTTLGFSFGAQTMTVIRIRAYGRGTAASLAAFIDTCGVVMMNTGPTPAVSTATPAAAPLIALVGAPTAPTALLAVSGNDVVINFTGAATAFNWVIDVNVEDSVPVAAGA